MILTIKAVIDVASYDVAFWKRLVVIIALFATSWAGLLFYYLFAKGRLESWLR